MAVERGMTLPLLTTLLHFKRGMPHLMVILAANRGRSVIEIAKIVFCLTVNPRLMAIFLLSRAAGYRGGR